MTFLWQIFFLIKSLIIWKYMQYVSVHYSFERFQLSWSSHKIYKYINNIHGFNFTVFPFLN